MTAPARQRSRIPRLADDYTRAAAAERTGFLRAVTAASPDHIGRYSVDPAVARPGNGRGDEGLNGRYRGAVMVLVLR